MNKVSQIDANGTVAEVYAQSQKAICQNISNNKDLSIRVVNEETKEDIQARIDSLYREIGSID